jgi:SAM-dependent methyltransferase
VVASGPLQPLPKLIEFALAVRPRRILDLGMGTGKYGFMLREQTDLAYGRARDEWRLHLTGVEGHADNVRAHQRSIYDEVAVADITDFLVQYEGEPFDLTLLIDVIEHFPPQAAEQLVDRILAASRYLLISTPTAYYRQDNGDNPLQLHRSWWPQSELRGLGHAGVFGKIGHCNVALLAAGGEPLPKLTFNRPLRSVAAFAKDRFIPEVAYRRIRHEVGPRLSDTG